MPENDPLRELLRAWESDPAPAPRFASEVWRRIEAGPPSWRERLAALLGGSSQLAGATAAAALLLMAALGGGALAQWHARDEVRAQLASDYVQSIDPLLMAAARSHHP